MSRSTLTAVLAACAMAAPPLPAADPHLDRTLVPAACSACHEGHGIPGSPMLPRPQDEVCLACHDTQAKSDEQVRRGVMSPAARPPLLGSALARAYAHELTRGARSRFDPGAVTCASCHSPHRRSTQLAGAGVRGMPKPSTRNPRKLEFELCEECHGNGGPETVSGLDLSRQLDPTNRSFHPVVAQAVERAPSIDPALAGRRINCTDCHASSDATGPRGPHASEYAGILGRSYVTVDGRPESPTAYELCYSCHDRAAVLDGPRFRLHRLHVVDQAASCATCHSAHGSVRNRALIRFGEETTIAGVSPSASTGRLEFDSDSPGRGNCYLSCHGAEHGPKAYGAEKPDPAKLLSREIEQPAAPGASPHRREGPRERDAERQRALPPP